MQYRPHQNVPHSSIFSTEETHAGELTHRVTINPTQTNVAVFVFYRTAFITVSQAGGRSIWKKNSCKLEVGMHYEKAARNEAGLQKTVKKTFFKK